MTDLRVLVVEDEPVMRERLVDMLYTRNDMDFHRGTFRVRGDVVEIFPQYESERAIRERERARRGCTGRRRQCCWSACTGCTAALTNDSLPQQLLPLVTPDFDIARRQVQ